MKIGDGNYWSPDGGYFTAKGDKIFWEDGGIAANPMGGPFRLMPSYRGLDCSLMTDEERAAKQARAKADREAYAIQMAEHEKQHEALLASAKAKLTEDEYAACLEEGRY